jgi:hypothetical protein
MFNGKKAASYALLIIVLPLFWLIFFKLLLHWFDPGLYIFVSAASLLMTSAKQGWGIIDNLAISA